MSDLPMHRPIIRDYGLYAEHDQPCACCAKNKAILQMNLGVFMPCDACSKTGYALVRRKKFGPIKWWASVRKMSVRPAERDA